MSTIQKKSIQSTIIIMGAFAIGAFNLLVLAPRILTTEQFGLTRVIGDAALTLATMCTLGCLPIIYKFFPFYKAYLPIEKNDLPFFTGMVCLTGLIVCCFIGWLCRDLIEKKFIEKSPLFVNYSYLVYPYCVCILGFMWLESFTISFRRSNLSNALREFVPRILFTLLLALYAWKLISDKGFYQLFSLSFLLPALILFIVLRGTGRFRFVTTMSPVTSRLKGKMISFGLFIFGSQFLNLLSKTADTFIITGKSPGGLADAAVFTIATYVVTLMEVPQRSMNSVTTPVLAEAWKDKAMLRIRSIYVKSVTNLLLVGLTMFGLMWLNLHNIAGFLGKDFSGVDTAILIMGIGKLIDLGTGANSQIIGTSSYWKVDFTTNVIYTIIALPLNFLLITHFGIKGAAYATLISLSFYNLMRFGFLWWKFNMQPYTWKDLLAVVLAIAGILLVKLVPHRADFIVDAIIRSILFIAFFATAIYVSRISEEANKYVDRYLKR
ncbi:lipopolysaccharide biosynthesis protein [Flavihumibacter petaseus]|uniref:Uncharacterized protein n=1 Tax=Flavihumibacter petaseus NBRC 106054 TaxID=1220578 RepID=A0A0E9N110_9BACT|nr:lipopolysaccharide biosynthesis protein [Flavihumibacter petaseus]GAO43707.1 hypothetical protein FPE01S_02_08130 [Flavihumibacter petaseus NBRC 106054]